MTNNSNTHQRAPIVLTMIVRNEALDLAACLETVRPYVERIVIVDTGSTDDTMAIAKPYADVLERWTGCNNAQGQIENFSAGRNEAIRLARSRFKKPPPLGLWLDGDDLLEGGEHLWAIVAETHAQTAKNLGEKHNFVVTFPYHVKTLTYPRERIFPLADAAWTGHVHEILIRPSTQSNAIVGARSDTRTIVRHAPSKDKPREPSRNLRILRTQLQQQGVLDPRGFYYLGRECIDNGRGPEGLRWLEHYVQISRWDQERCAAFMRMAEAYMGRIDYDAAEIAALRAVGARPDWAEPRLLLARVYHLRAMRAHGGVLDGADHRRVVALIPEALAMPPSRMDVFLDRSLREQAHLYLNVSRYHLGDLPGALASIEAGLRDLPDHPQLIENRARIEAELHQRAGNVPAAVAALDAGLVALPDNAALAALRAALP